MKKQLGSFTLLPMNNRAENKQCNKTCIGNTSAAIACMIHATGTRGR